MKRTFFLIFSFFLLVSTFVAFTAENPKIAAQIQQIDSQLEELREMKRGFEARALRHENQAEYLQFEQEAFLETRRHLQLADENRAKAAKVQQEIDRLQAKKDQLLGLSVK